MISIRTDVDSETLFSMDWNIFTKKG